MTKNKKNTKEFVKLYVPELMQLVNSGDEKMCLMMAQLEYWFGIKPDGFYKFMTIPEGESSAYLKGDSWTEEMGMSKTKIDNGLKSICTHYKTRTAYKDEVGDKFKGNFYCSYYHKPSHLTFYFRNHDKVNEALASLSLENKSNIFREKHSVKVGKEEMDFSGFDESYFPGDIENDIADFIEDDSVYTENTSENTSKNEQREREESSHSFISVKEKKPFPSEFELTPEMLAWAKAKRSNVDIENSTDKFRVYYYGKLSDDWLGAWQRWILNEKNEIKKSSSEERLDIYNETSERYKELYNSEDISFTESWGAIFDEN